MDVFHVSEHLHACGRTLYGEHTEAARRWAGHRLEMLLQSDPVTVLRELEQVLGARPATKGSTGP